MWRWFPLTLPLGLRREWHVKMLEVKTLQQTEPQRFGHLALPSAARVLVQEGGVSSLFLGLTPTLAGWEHESI